MAFNCGPILVVDGDPLAAASISELLRHAGFACHAVATGEDGLIAAREHEPSLVILTDELPGMCSYDLCRALRDEFGEILPIVFVSRLRKEPLDCVAALLIGADDYVIDPFVPMEFVARVRRMVRRAAAFGSLQQRTSHNLTAREVEVLTGLADGWSQDEIARRFVISPKTVATHIERILGKLGVHSRAEAVAAAYQRGIVETGKGQNGQPSLQPVAAARAD